MNLIITAAQFAAEKHQGQFRKWTNRPHIEHPMRVAGRVAMQPGASEEHVAAAWLHDVIEDCGVTPEQLHDTHRFPMTTVDLVRELTNPSKQYPSRSREDRKAMDREHLRTVSYWAKVIKLLDRIDNVRDMRACDDRDFQRLYVKETELLIGVLVKTPDHTIHELIRELHHELDYYDTTWSPN